MLAPPISVSISVGWGNRDCTDPLNSQYFWAPTMCLAQEEGSDKLLVLLDASLIVSENRNRRGDPDCSVGEFEDFFSVLKAALIAGLNGQTASEEK